MFDHVADKLERYMDLLSTRQKLVASNIANVDTPGYKTRDIDFQFEFVSRVGTMESTAQATGSTSQIRNASWRGPDSPVSSANNLMPHVIEPDLPSKNDGNNVSIDRETRLLAENGVRFQMASLLTRAALRRVRSAIQEGRSG
jgi:flagellar basal-body rod protein FlgB